MSRPGITSERLISLFLLGLLLLNPPLLSIFDVPDTAVGIPILYIYLFTAWAVLVLLMALIIESAAATAEGQDPVDGQDPGEEAGATEGNSEGGR